MKGWQAMDAAQCWQSSTFSLGGIERMQFSFYPNGQRQEESVGSVAIVLTAPPGSHLSGTLTVGHQKRQLDHAFGSNGTYVRHAFCRLDTLSDDLLISFELHTATQEVAKTSSKGQLKLTRATSGDTLAEVMKVSSIWTRPKTWLEEAYDWVEGGESPSSQRESPASEKRKRPHTTGLTSQIC